MIARAGIGYDKIDLAVCTANDVVVFNSPNGLTHSTAVGAYFFIIALSKRYHIQERLTRERRWDLGKYAGGDDLAGLTLGIIGLGKTGIELARLMAPFRMRIIAYSPHADPAKAAQVDIELVGSMDEVLKRSDYISLHGRLDQRTREMIGEREFGLMKPTAFFVNVARGEMVDEDALARVLRERRIAGAGLDVFHVEPLPADSPLMKLDNVILTQHSICGSRQAGRATNQAVMQGMLRIARGELPDNILNPDVLDRPRFRGEAESPQPQNAVWKGNPSMKIDLEGKVALVTGAGQGIGEAIARDLASHGAQVVYADMNIDTAKASAAKSPRAIPMLMDVTKPNEVEAGIARIQKECGRLDILVNNAGINSGKEFRVNIDKFSPEQWDRVVKVDLTGVFLVSRAASQLMVAQKAGRIVNIASVLGVVPARLQCAFTAAKAGVVNLSKTMAIELAPDNILVNCVCPGTMEYVYVPGSPLKDFQQRILSHVPLARPGTFAGRRPRGCVPEVAPESSYITGQTLCVDGGWTAGGFFRDF